MILTVILFLCVVVIDYFVLFHTSWWGEFGKFKKTSFLPWMADLIILFVTVSLFFRIFDFYFVNLNSSIASAAVTCIIYFLLNAIYNSRKDKS